MANLVRGGFGWQLRPQQEEVEEAEEEEEEEFKGRIDEEQVPYLGEGESSGHGGVWNVSSPHRTEEGTELEDLKDYWGFLAKGDTSFDLGELQDIEHPGEDNLGSPLPGHTREKSSTKSLSHGSYWRSQSEEEQLSVPEGDQDQGSAEELEEQQDNWEAGSTERALLGLSYEVQYGSEYSTSPEALRDPLALYKCGKSYSFTSEDGADEFLGDLSPSHLRLPPKQTHQETDLLDSQSLCSEKEFPEEEEFSPTSKRSQESNALLSPVGSTLRTDSPMGHQSTEDLRNSPGSEARTFPKSSWTEDMTQPVGCVAKLPVTSTSKTAQGGTLPPARSKVKVVESSGGVDAFHGDYQQLKRSQKLKADVPHGLPSKFNQQSRSLSPQARSVEKKVGGSALSGPVHSNQSTPVTGDTSRYGQGQLNYPLPDLSKVEPRVRFPKDAQSYHPPRGRSRLVKSKEPTKPVIFKSPAEIVREVLLSSGEGSPQKCPTPAGTVIPEEFKSPRQATELVHQLQEDYHKLLTKYAEAENTIDRLRLGAKVRLYADPPKPNHGCQTGVMPQASKIMTFCIPQISRVEVAGTSSQAPDASKVEGSPGPQVTSDALRNSIDDGFSGAEGFPSVEGPSSGNHLTKLLASHASKFQTQVASLEELIHTGKLSPQDQLKEVARLKEAQNALEQAYLQARDKHRWMQNQQEPMETLGDFDPDRAVEGKIFHLEMRLEELRERIEQATGNPLPVQSSFEEVRSSPAHSEVKASQVQMGLLAPFHRAPIPADHTPYPETSILKDGHNQDQIDEEMGAVGGGSEEEEEEEGLPEPLQHRQLQMETNFGHLLDHYSSLKSLPEAMSSEQLHLVEDNLSLEEVDGGAAGHPWEHGDALQMLPPVNKTDQISPSLLEIQERKPLEMPPREPWQLSCQNSSASPAQVKESLLQEFPKKGRSSIAISRLPSWRKHKQQNSMVGRAGSTGSEPRAQKTSPKTSVDLPEDLRIVSPETDSGFLGSEASRISPLAQMSKSHPNHLRFHSILRKPQSPEEALHLASVRKDSVVLEPLEVELSPSHGLSRGGLSGGSLVQHDSPPSLASEVESETESTQMDSEAEIRGEGGTHKTPSAEMRPSSGSSAPFLSPSRTRGYSLLESRLERDQAIVALQNEVSQLRQSLEETLHWSHSDPKHLSFPSSSKFHRRPHGIAHWPSSANSVRSASIPIISHAKALRKSTTESQNPAVVTEQSKRPSVLKEGVSPTPVTSEPNYSKPKLWKEKQKGASISGKNLPKNPVFQGPYTGTQYTILSPEAPKPKTHKDFPSCPRCQGIGLKAEPSSTSDPDPKETKGGDSQKNSSSSAQHSSPQKPKAASPVGKDAGSPKIKAKCGEDCSRGSTSVPNSGTRQERNPHRPAQPPAAPWYLALPPVAAPMGFIPTITLAPGAPASAGRSCSPLAPTSTSTPAGLSASKYQAAVLRKRTCWQPSHGHRCSLTLDCDHLDDLNWCLNRAVEAAKDMKVTTKRMSQSLTLELRKARSHQGSCFS